MAEVVQLKAGIELLVGEILCYNTCVHMYLSDKRSLFHSSEI